MAAPRYDYYQTATQVVVSVYAKGLDAGTVHVHAEERLVRFGELRTVAGALTLQIELRVNNEDGEPLLRLAPLCGTINKYTVAERVLPTKVDIALDKVPAGVQWPALIREGAAVGADKAAPAASAAPATERPRGPSKWDSLETEEEAPASGDAELNQFFQKLYADADPDTRRAMVKSFQESNGTTLSTNWDEVRSKPTETRAPAGMEARRYEQ